MTAEMVPEAAKLHLDAFVGYMNTRLGSAYIKRFIRWFCEEESAIALVVIDSNRKEVISI